MNFDIFLSHTTNKIYSQLSDIISSQDHNSPSRGSNPYANFSYINSSILVKMLLSLNLWRETLLLNTINEESILKVKDFGLLPGNIIFRETEDYIIYTLEDYLSRNARELSDEDTINEEEKEIEDESISQSEMQKKSFEDEPTIFKRKKTEMSEDDSIEVILKVIELLEKLHSRGIIHTNLNPCEIFFKIPDDLDSLCFNSLYYCSWDPNKLLKKRIPNTDDNPSIYDLTLRRKEYLSPEHIEFGEKFEQIGKENNIYSIFGLENSLNQMPMNNSDYFENTSFEESNMKIMNKMEKLTFSCDIFSLGIILFRCLIGVTPPPSFYESVSEYVKAEETSEKKPTDNIYSPPAFLHKYILSDGM